MLGRFGILAALLLAGCSVVQGPSLDRLDRSLDRIMGMQIDRVVDWLGDPAVISDDGPFTRYGWVQSDLVRPCTLELWADENGRIRKSKRDGYERSCKPFADQLL